MPRSNRISVLIVDDMADTRSGVQKLLQFESDIDVVGSASTGQQAIELAKKLTPNIVLMDVQMPGMDGIETAEALQSLSVPCQVIMMSVNEEQDHFRRAMLAGARGFLVKPFSGEEVALAIRKVFERGGVVTTTSPIPVPGDAPALATEARIISVFSPKGGVGRTTIACNLAVALRQNPARPNARVALVDCSLPFGDVGVFLDVQPVRTLGDLLPHIAALDEGDLLGEFFSRHGPSGVEVLLAPIRPESAELVTAEAIKRILAKMRESFDYIVVDTSPTFAETNLAVLDASDRIVVPLTLDLSAVKNVRLFLEVAQTLNYDREKLLLVLNRATSNSGINPREVEARLSQPIASRIDTDETQAMHSLNQGVPVVTRSRNSPLAKNLLELADQIDRQFFPRASEAKVARGGLFSLARRPAAQAL